MLPILSYVQHYKKYHAARFEAASVQYGLNQLEIDILLFLHNNPDCRTASDICRYRGLAKSNVSAAGERAGRAGGGGALPAKSRKHAIMAGSPLISQRTGPLTASPAGEAILPRGFNVNAHFRHQKRLRVPPVVGGVPDAPREG